jgi:hypothetical protein
MLNPTLFQLLRIKPFLRVLNISPSRFTQKLYHYQIRGVEQQFTEEELQEIKMSLHVAAAIIEEEAAKM